LLSLPGGDSKLVFSAIPVVRTESSISLGSAAPPRSSDAWPARYTFQSMATPASFRMRCTAGTWSRPVPPPWINVTRRLIVHSASGIARGLRTRTACADLRGVQQEREAHGGVETSMVEPVPVAFASLGVSPRRSAYAVRGEWSLLQVRDQPL